MKGETISSQHAGQSSINLNLAQSMPGRKDGAGISLIVFPVFLQKPGFSRGVRPVPTSQPHLLHSTADGPNAGVPLYSV